MHRFPAHAVGSLSLAVALSAASALPQEPRSQELHRGDALLAELRTALAALGETPPPADAEQRWMAAVERITAEPRAMGHDRFVAAAQALYSAQRYAACAHLGRMAIANLDDARGLFDLVGMSHLALAQRMPTHAAMREQAAQAVDAFQRARTDPASLPSRRLLYQALWIDCRFERALLDLDAMAGDARVRPFLPKALAPIRGSLLLAAGRADDAVRAFTDPGLSPQQRAELEPQRIRALARSGRSEQAVAAARTAWQQRSGQEQLGVLVDVLALAGERDAALQLLREHPIEGDADDPTVAARQQARAAFAYLVGIGTDRPADLRQVLATHLGRRRDVGDGALAVTPILLGTALDEVTVGPRAWADALLSLVCIADQQRHQPDDREAALVRSTLTPMQRAAICGPDAATRAQERLASCLSLHFDGGVLTALRIAERL